MAFAIAAMSLLSTVFLSSCREERVKKGTTEGNLRISLPLSMPSFRSDVQDPMTTISKVSFLFFNGDNESSRIVEKRDELLASTTKRDFSLQLTPANYFLLVVANATPEMENRMKIGATLKEVNADLCRINMSHYQDPETMQCLLLNDQALVPVTKEHFADPKHERQIPPLVVNIEPCLARFIVHDYPVISADLTNLAPDKYAFEVGVSENYFTPIRRMHKLASGKMEARGDGSSAKDRYAMTAGAMLVEKMVAEKRNRNDIINALLEDNVGEWPIRNKRGYAPPIQEWFDASTSLQQKLASKHSYKVETTAPEGSQETFAYPFVCLIYRLIPKGFDLGNDEGFATYRNKPFKESELRAMLQAAAAGKKVTIPKGFDASMEDDIKMVITNPLYKDLAIGFTVGDISYYQKAQSYYPIFIRHFSDEVAPELSSYGRYGIVRNNEYHLKISKIRKLGYATPVSFINDQHNVTEKKPVDYSISVEPIVVHDLQEMEF